MSRLLFTLILLCACAYLSLTYSHEDPEQVVTITARHANKAHMAAPTGTIATFAAQQRAVIASRINDFPATVETRSDTLIATSTPSGTASQPTDIELPPKQSFLPLIWR